MADAYLTTEVRELPNDMLFDGHRLKHNVRSYVAQGVVRVMAGPEFSHVIIDMRRPYFRPGLPISEHASP